MAEHQLAVSRRECVGAKPGPPNVAVAVAIALPEGVLAITRPGERQPLWQQKVVYISQILNARRVQGSEHANDETYN